MLPIKKDVYLGQEDSLGSVTNKKDVYLEKEDFLGSVANKKRRLPRKRSNS